jgi:hypothetical protein
MRLPIRLEYLRHARRYRAQQIWLETSVAGVMACAVRK